MPVEGSVVLTPSSKPHKKALEKSNSLTFAAVGHLKGSSCVVVLHAYLPERHR